MAGYLSSRAETRNFVSSNISAWEKQQFLAISSRRRWRRNSALGGARAKSAPVKKASGGRFSYFISGSHSPGRLEHPRLTVLLLVVGRIRLIGLVVVVLTIGRFFVRFGGLCLAFPSVLLEQGRRLFLKNRFISGIALQVDTEARLLGAGRLHLNGPTHDFTRFQGLQGSELNILALIRHFGLPVASNELHRIGQLGGELDIRVGGGSLVLQGDFIYGRFADRDRVNL